MKKRLQDKIAGSRFSLPITALLILTIWIVGGIADNGRYLNLGIFAISTYLMVELNNSNALIRVYSRMVSCTFLVVTTMAAFMFTNISVWIMQACVITSLLALLKSYQDKKAQGTVFYAFALIGIASTQFVQILFFVPFVWLIMAVNLMSFSFRSLLASIIGLMAPYWFWAGYCVFYDSLDTLIAHFESLIRFAPLFRYQLSDISLIATIAYLGLLVLIGSIHFLRNSYKDKIRTRMIYEMFITLSTVTVLFIILQPNHAIELTAILTVNASVLFGHFFALTHTRITNIAVILLLLCAFALTLFNLYGLAS